MRAANLKEAMDIVSSLAWLNEKLSKSLTTESQRGSVVIEKPTGERGYRSGETMPLSREAAEAALAVMRQQWTARAAELRRRAAQLGLIL